MTTYCKYKGETAVNEIETETALYRLDGYWQDAPTMLASGDVLQTDFAWYSIDKAKLEEIGN